MKKGFTLIELLVVITIIAILSTIGLTMYQNSQKAARDAKRKQDLQTIAEALEQKKGISGSYPAACNNIRSDSSSWNITSCGLTNYLRDMPQDPINQDNYRYHLCIDTSGAYFVLVANLELGTDQGEHSDCKTVGSIRYWIKSRQ